MGKDKSWRQTPALGMDNEASGAESCEKKNIKFMQKDFFSAVRSVLLRKLLPPKHYQSYY